MSKPDLARMQAAKLGEAAARIEADAISFRRALFDKGSGALTLMEAHDILFLVERLACIVKEMAPPVDLWEHL